MINLFKICFALCLIGIVNFSYGQKTLPDELKNADVRVYKTVDGYDLKISIVYPDNYKKGKKYPAVVFFFGGGWNGGSVGQFEQHCHFLAKKGMISMAANYRVASRNNSTPFDAVEDAKSAVRWIRENAKSLGVNKNRIVASGGSAGGHVAACTAIIPGFEAANENLKVSSKPNALVLFNPVINTMPEGFGYQRLGDKAESISPAHHVVPGLPPTLIFHGTADTTVPYGNITDFLSKMEAVGNTCYVVPFEGQKHGFFNYGRNENKFYDLTMERMESFLWELKYIKR